MVEGWTLEEIEMDKLIEKHTVHMESMIVERGMIDIDQLIKELVKIRIKLNMEYYD